MNHRQLIGCLLLVASFLVGACVPGLVAATLYVNFPDPEAEYWRGVYDVCLAQTKQPEMCLESVARFKAEHSEEWYEAPSPGYEWPLPAPASNEAPQPSRGYPSEQALNG